MLELSSRLLEAEAALRQCERIQTIGQVADGIAHGIDHCLAVIRSSVDLLRPDTFDERRNPHLDAISKAADRASEFIEKLFAFTRRDDWKSEVVDGTAVLRGVEDFLRSVAGAGMSVSSDVPDCPSFLNIDINQLQTALIEVVVHARQALHGEGALNVRMSSADRIPSIRNQASTQGLFAKIEINVSGKGPAIQALDPAPDLFLTTNDEGQRWGVGLSRVFAFAKKAGGAVNVERLSCGVAMVLYLPQLTVGRGGGGAD